MTRALRWLLLALVLLFGAPSIAEAYVGPGAGLAFLTSFAVAIGTGILAVVSLLAWPFRALWRLVMQRRAHPKIQRLILLGFDGQDAGVTEERMARGELPNFKRLADHGSYRRLRTVDGLGLDWAAFCQGRNPVSPVESPAFWTLLGKSRVWSTVLRVPGRFTPDRFFGAQLCVASGDSAAGGASYPRYYATYLSKKTAAPGSTDGARIDAESLCVTALDTLRRGALVCVFAEAGHRKDYEHNDKIIERVMQSLSPQDLLVVFSTGGSPPDKTSGVFLCNRLIAHADPALIDLAPTAFERFGIEVPSHMDGHSLFTREAVVRSN